MSLRTTVLVLASALLYAACSDPSEPAGAAVTIDVPPQFVDTVEGRHRVEVTLRGEDGLPAVAQQVRLYIEGGLFAPSEFDRRLYVDLTSDGAGRAGVDFVLGREPGSGTVRAVFGLEEDIVRFGVLPGALARLMPVPAETALAVGHQYTIAIRAADRFGNLREDNLPTPVVQSLRSDVAVVNGGRIATVAPGRATLRLDAAGIIDSAQVSVMPPGTLVVFDTVQLPPAAASLLDLESGALTALTGVERADCAVWHPDGVRMLLRGVRLATPGGTTEELLPGAAGLDAECGEFTRDGEWIFFEVARSADVSQIWRIRADGTGLELITPDEDVDAYSPSPSPDGARIAYVLRYPNRAINSHFIVVRNVATGAVDTIASSVDNENVFAKRQASVAWSPTGEWIAYTAPGQPYYFSIRSWDWGSYVHILRPDGSDPRTIEHPARYHRSFFGDVSWSPDGRWLAARLHYPDLRIAMIDLVNGDVLPMNSSTRAFSRPVWRP